MASSQPQPIHQHHRQYHNAQDYSQHYHNAHAPTNSGSSAINHDFNPASYTRHFLGSPISWRAASFGSHLFPNGSPGYMNVDHHSDLKKLSSSIENEQSAGTFFNALSSLDQGELCRNYTCCGVHLNDLHALLEHFEVVHVVVVDDPNGPSSQVTLPFNPQPLPTPRPNPVQTNGQQPLPASHQPNGGYFPYPNGPHPHQDPAAFDPDDMDIEMDTAAQSPNKRTPSSGAPSPPDTPVTTPSVSHPFPISVHTTHAYNPHANTYHSQPPSPNRINTFDSSTLLRPLSAFANPVGATPSRPDAFHPYTGYGQNSNSSSSSIAGAMGDSIPAQPSQDCVPPALLFSSADGSSPKDGSTSPRSTPSSPDHVPANTVATAPSSRASTASRPSTSMLLSKPFRCPKPNCNKSYKQANGLKYHITHGSCNFTPAKEVEQVQAIIAQRQNSHPSSPTTPHSNDTGALGSGLSENELREVEKEAERQLRPFACGVGDCQRRYKNMNGLRYHYQHTGEHGAIGLALLASGTHPCLNANRHSAATAKDTRRVGSRASSRAGSRPTTPPLMSPPPFPASLQQQQATVQNYTQPVTAVPVQMGFVNGSRVH